MATYKVIQDIEAEDHILGPLSLRQFIYALIAAACLYFSYLSMSKGASFLLVMFLPVALFTGFFAFPFGRDQPTEIWALAKIRYYFKPRKRIWDQSGVKELVTVTVPKKIEVRRSDGLSQNEVQSRLSALANTIDSRGWVVKNSAMNSYSSSSLLDNSNSDRLLSPNEAHQNVPSYDINAADDILDAQNNPIAQQFDQMITASAATHRQQLVSMMEHGGDVSLPAPVATNTPTSVSNNWFLQQPSPLTANAPQQTTTVGVTGPAPIAQTPSQTDTEISSHLRSSNTQQNAAFGNMKTILPMGQQPPPTPAPTPSQPSDLSRQLATNNDLNISTLARVANKKDLPEDDEVIISLH